MAKKKGAVKAEEKYEEKTRAEIALIAKQAEIKAFKRKRKFFTIPTTKGIVETTDIKKWEEYQAGRAFV